MRAADPLPADPSNENRGKRAHPLTPRRGGDAPETNVSPSKDSSTRTKLFPIMYLSKYQQTTTDVDLLVVSFIEESFPALMCL